MSFVRTREDEAYHRGFTDGAAAQRRALAERVEKLHAALRERAIGFSYTTDAEFENDTPSGAYCMVCERRWSGEEQHSPGCLAAPDSAAEQGGAE